MDTDQNPKTQVVERLREAQNVLVTVSANPSVDQLCAAVGFTLMMNKLGKHATAVFSGQVPSTIEFLKPEETLETNTDSLRDFIISLDKSKADKLRYKVEADVVKIFITPYRTSLSENDLDFSQGDFNVDVVVALGVDEREHLDQAIVEHGRILHDATVLGIANGQQKAEIGGINWQDSQASSLCEMLVSISEAFKGGIIDGQIATAFLTGIVAQTNRFSNDKTSPKVMTMAAQLMAAGANQQLIATKLELPAQPITEPGGQDNTGVSVDDGGVLNLHNDKLPKPVDGFNDTEPLLDASEIHIDEHGEIKPHPASSPNEPEATDTSLENEIKQYSKYITEAPQSGGVLTANARPEQLEASSDPLSSNAPQLPPAENDQRFSSHAKNLRPIDENQKLGPDVTNNETLTDIESSVQNYSGGEPRQNLDTNQARDAVENAAGASFNPAMPEPIQALGAQNINLDDNSAPSVPPPIMPPFSSQPPVEPNNQPQIPPTP